MKIRKNARFIRTGGFRVKWLIQQKQWYGWRTILMYDDLWLRDKMFKQLNKAINN